MPVCVWGSLKMSIDVSCLTSDVEILRGGLYSIVESQFVSKAFPSIIRTKKSFKSLQ